MGVTEAEKESANLVGQSLLHDVWPWCTSTAYGPTWLKVQRGISSPSDPYIYLHTNITSDSIILRLIMVGIPLSRGCEGCRKAKKGCDGQKPACGRCARRKQQCIGNGVRRVAFRTQDFQLIGGRVQHRLLCDSPRPAPSNQETRMAGALVSMLELPDAAFNIVSYGAFVTDLPRHVGSSKVLDVSIATLIASFNSLRHGQPRHDALALHVNAVSTLRRSMREAGRANRACSPDVMAAIYIIRFSRVRIPENTPVFCSTDHSGPLKDWVITEETSVTHGEIIMHLLYHADDAGLLDNINPDLMQTLCATTVFESFLNPRIQLEERFWNIFNRHTFQQAMVYVDGRSLVSLELQTIAGIAIMLRDPKKNIYQIRCAYDMFLMDYCLLIPQLDEVIADASKPGASFADHRRSLRYQTAFSSVLSLAAVLNRIIRISDDDPQLTSFSRQLCDDIISVSERCSQYRPLGASSMPIALQGAWATTPDGYRLAEIETLLKLYQQDFPGMNHFAGAQCTKNAFNRMEDRWKRSMDVDLMEFEHATPPGNSNCVIL
ncbi:hypothetical protein FALBO_9016 [Fusarium albosuccineum]|uniref:Zn(2)-C6 fungal-type domain-containing protein n=1 Tax=Fusarium albosuccineum TaxID=1237068 RepID=A0A8H4L9T3_9HYPO|nr:hypothetical protein FALBO_9016 [Fusarium albosuccineum]